MDAVAEGEAEVAVVWVPLAGYFAGKQRIPLQLTPVAPRFDAPSPPFVCSISMGVRSKEIGFKQEIEAAIRRNRAKIDQILAEYDIPRLDTPQRPDEKEPGGAFGFDHDLLHFAGFVRPGETYLRGSCSSRHDRKAGQILHFKRGASAPKRKSNLLLERPVARSM